MQLLVLVTASATLLTFTRVPIGSVGKFFFLISRASDVCGGETVSAALCIIDMRGLLNEDHNARII
jgi:hypothetical protein